MGAAIWIIFALICCGWLLFVIREIHTLTQPAPAVTEESK